MESFLKSLSLYSSATVKDVTYNCIKILDWIYKTSLSSNNLCYKDVENIGKGIVYLKSCYKLFEEELPNLLLKQYPFFAKEVKEFFSDASKSRFKSIAQIFEKVAQTEQGLEHIFILETILNIPHESNEVPIALEYSCSQVVKEAASTLKMRMLVQKIFQLPKEQVHIAIERMLNNIPFQVIGLVFCEPKNSYYSDACCILAYKIYENLSSGCISTFFIRSLYFFSSTSQSGKRSYWHCLRNTDFENGMTLFFIRTLTYMSKEKLDYNVDIAQICFEKHKLSHVFYLIWAALSHLSPCHSELYKHIVDANLSSYLVVINKFDRIYE